MVTVTYIEHDGTEHAIDAEVGKSLMQNAVDNMVPGIDADCGGGCACATCHVFIPEQWRELTGERNPMENSMLQLADRVQDNSRLSCQIDVSEGFEGMSVHMPESQH
ncbi:MAG: 2Fe-2S iron-sulfur cluster-binding protein [Gammaproteobacteria bacterium]|nr:2Fe-2S iron-sulfur cluster-binding protein [Gammaproteobacteria bacterium]